MPYDKANQILDQHVPGRAAANGILATRVPSIAAGNRILAGAGRGVPQKPAPGGWGAGGSGPLKVPAGRSFGQQIQDDFNRRGVHGDLASPSPLAQAVAENARATQQAGGVVNINVWAGLLGNAGVSSDVIRGAYDGAGGDGVLAPAEASGDTSQFLGAFVQGLEQLGVDPNVIVSTYQQAGGTVGAGGAISAAAQHGGGMFGHAVSEAEKVIAGGITTAEDFIRNPIGTTVGGVEHGINEAKKFFGL